MARPPSPEAENDGSGYWATGLYPKVNVWQIEYIEIATARGFARARIIGGTRREQAHLPKALDEGHLRAVLVPQPKNASPPRRPAPFARRGRSDPRELGGLGARGRTSNVTSTSQRCRAYRPNERASGSCVR